MKGSAAVLMGMLMVGQMGGQSVGQRPRFEVASVKAGGNLFARVPPKSSPGRFSWTTQVNYLIAYAYSVDVSGVRGNRLGDVYSVDAVFDPEGEVRLMLQSLLAERFHLAQHVEEREVEGYALLPGKGGSKLKESAASGDGESYVSATLPLAGVVEITGKRAGMAELVTTLSRSAGMALWDETGLKGKYDFVFRFAKEGVEAEGDTPSLPAALREDLGLVLKRERGTVKTLVVDRLDVPSGN